MALATPVSSNARSRRHFVLACLTTLLLAPSAHSQQSGSGPSMSEPLPVVDQAPSTMIHMVQRSRREPQRPLDHRIVAMPKEYQKLEVIHHRSQLVITRNNVRRFAITDPSIIEIVQYTPNEFAIIGNTRGTTDMMIWFEDQDEPLMYLVTVVPDPALEERRRIDYGKIERKLAILYPNSKVYLIPMSRKIIVRGQARDAEEAARIMQIVRGEVLTQDGALFAGYTGGDANLVDPNALGQNNTGNLLSSLIVNELQVPGEFQIKIRVRIAELNRSMLRQYGINWNSIIQFSGDSLAIGSNLNGGNAFSLTGIFEDVTINGLINALHSNGTIKILEDATLVTLSGEPAAFLSGGEFAVPSTVGLQGVGVATTTFRGFGTSIIATPTVIDHDLIRLQIVPELSQINPNNSVGGVFGVDVKRVQTRVELREGQTIVLGGLFERQQNVEQTRIPLLGEIPILGSALFHSRRATEDELELLIVVTPEFVRPLDADQEPPLPGWYVTHPDDFDFYKLNRTEGEPDLGHYQLLPFGNGQGYAHDVGYNIYNPAPMDGGLNPIATGGGYTGYGDFQVGTPQFGSDAYAPFQNQFPAPGQYPSPAPYGNPRPAQPPSAPAFGPAPGVQNPMMPTPEPTPAMPAPAMTHYRSVPGQQGRMIQQTRGIQGPGRSMNAYFYQQRNIRR